MGRKTKSPQNAAPMTLLGVPCVGGAGEGLSRFVTTRNSPQFLPGDELFILCLHRSGPVQERSNLQHKALSVSHDLSWFDQNQMSSNLSDAQSSSRDPDDLKFKSNPKALDFKALQTMAHCLLL